MDTTQKQFSLNRGASKTKFFQEEGRRVATAPRCADGKNDQKKVLLPATTPGQRFLVVRQAGAARRRNNTLRKCRHSTLENNETHEQSRFAGWRYIGLFGFPPPRAGKPLSVSPEQLQRPETHSDFLKTKQLLLIALVLTLPLVGALAQQWSTDNLASALISCWLDDDDDERDTHSGTLEGDPNLAAAQTADFNVNFRRVITSAKCREGLTLTSPATRWRSCLPRSPPASEDSFEVGGRFAGAGTASIKESCFLSRSFRDAGGRLHAPSAVGGSRQPATFNLRPATMPPAIILGCGWAVQHLTFPAANAAQQFFRLLLLESSPIPARQIRAFS